MGIMEKKIGIYTITSPSGKVYIGQSYNIISRWNSYRRRSVLNKGLQRFLIHSIIKYGYENHVFKIVHELPVDIRQPVMDLYEQIYMDSIRDVGIELLNIREAGSKGKLHESTKKRIGEANSKSLIGNVPVNKGVTMEEFYGKEQADKIKNQIRNKLKGTKASEKSLLKRREYFKNHPGNNAGKKASTETRLKQSISAKNRRK